MLVNSSVYTVDLTPVPSIVESCNEILKIKFRSVGPAARVGRFGLGSPGSARGGQDVGAQDPRTPIGQLHAFESGLYLKM